MKAVFFLLAMLSVAFPLMAQDAPQVGFFPQGMVPDFIVNVMTVVIPLAIIFAVILLFVPRRYARKIFKPWRLTRH